MPSLGERTFKYHEHDATIFTREELIEVQRACDKVVADYYEAWNDDEMAVWSFEISGYRWALLLSLQLLAVMPEEA